jgi:hypothetical protein
VGHPRIAEEEPVGGRVLVEVPEQGGEQVFHAGARREGHLRRQAQTLLGLGDQPVHDADEQLGPALGEVVVQQPLGDAGRARDLGQAYSA